MLKMDLVYKMETVVSDFKQTSFSDVSRCMVQPEMELTFFISNYYWPQLPKSITLVVIEKRAESLYRSQNKAMNMIIHYKGDCAKEKIELRIKSTWFKMAINIVKKFELTVFYDLYRSA